MRFKALGNGKNAADAVAQILDQRSVCLTFINFHVASVLALWNETFWGP